MLTPKKKKKKSWLGDNFGRQSQLLRQFQLERRFGPGNYPSSGIFFLTFFYSSFI